MKFLKIIKKIKNRSLSEALFAEKVLLVEGPSEQLLFDKVLSWKDPYYETKGIYILSVNGISFINYLSILNDLGISYTVKTDNDIQWRKENGFYALGFSRVNKLCGNKLLETNWEVPHSELTKSEFIAKSVQFRRQIYLTEEKNGQLSKIQQNHHIYLSQVDLEYDLDEVLHDRLVELLKEEKPVKYLQGAKNNRMVELVEKMTDKDCELIYNHKNFSCLKDVIE